MRSITDLIRALSNSELNEAFLNIKELNEKGFLGYGNVFRNLHKQIEDEFQIKYSIHALQSDLLYELASRSFPLPVGFSDKSLVTEQDSEPLPEALAQDT